MKVAHPLKLGRNPFARETLRKHYIRWRVPGPVGCWWCGGQGRLFFVEVEADSLPGHTRRLPGNFCSMDCARSYHSP
jgi:hypothetical protein